MSASRGRVVALLLLCAFFAHAPALLGLAPGAMPSTGDTIGAFVPWREFVRRELSQNGAIPLWNPHLLGGVPFAANGQSALFYPPHYLHFLLPENLAQWLFALGHTSFLMCGGYFLGRTLGVSRRASLLIGLLMGLGNATPAHLFGGHLTFLPARAFWPWQAAFLIRLLRGDSSYLDARTSLALAACLSLGLAAGAPQIWLFGVFFCAAIAAFWLVRSIKNRVSPRQWPWKALLLTLFLTILWCAPVLLPLRELKAWSSHGDMLSFEQVTDLSATPRSLFRLLLNNFFGGNSFWMWSLPSNPGEDGASIGLAGCILALAAPFFARRSNSVRALWLGCALTLVLALGSATPFYRVLYEHVFLFQITRVPARWLELWAFGAAILAGVCFETLLQNSSCARRFLPLWGGAALGCLTLGITVWLSKPQWHEGVRLVQRSLALPPERGPEIAAKLQGDALLSCALGFFAIALLLLLWRRPFQSSRQLALVLAVLCSEPLLNFWLSVRIAPPAAVENARLPAALAQQFRVGERWIVRAPFQQLNATLAPGIDAVNGYDPFGSAPFFALAGVAQPGVRFSADFQPQKMSPLWRVMGATHVLWKPRFDKDDLRGFGGKTIARSGQWRLNVINGLNPWPRAYLTCDLRRADGTQALVELQKLASYPFFETPPAVVSSGFPQNYAVPEAVPSGRGNKLVLPASVLQSANLQGYRLTPPTKAFFVQNEVMAPGWKAFVDEKPVQMYLANAIFRGVAVPAGAQKITMVYDSQTLRFSLFLCFSGLGLAAFCWVLRR